MRLGLCFYVYHVSVWSRWPEFQVHAAAHVLDARDGHESLA